MLEINTSRPVLVTGATGYVAGWLIKELLDAGVTVHATVRDPNDATKVKHLNDLAVGSKGRIVYFKADLLEEGAFSEAMKGCSVVFHTASPFTSRFKDPQKDLIDPAVLGTKNVLDEATRCASVTRVVVTSSCAAIYTDAADCQDAPGGVLTEEIWNTTASLAYQPYSYSKTLAEQEAWKIAKTQSQWDLVVVNPSLVIGPGMVANPTSESFHIIRQFGSGRMKAGAPRVGLGVVDVRDLAYAHMAAAFIKDAKGRHIISGHSTDLLAMAQTLLPKYGTTYPIPRKALPKWLLWLLGPSQGLSRQFITRNVNVDWRADTSKSQKSLGVIYRKLAESMEDMFAQMISSGAFLKK